MGTSYIAKTHQNNLNDLFTLHMSEYPILNFGRVKTRNTQNLL
jgi:hypothetical protein